jgi:hypothetical protein
LPTHSTGRITGGFFRAGRLRAQPRSRAAARTPSTRGRSSTLRSDIAGVVPAPNGPEAGVWVIAETTDLPTKFVKIVVTDDQGRYLLPDLPKATYDVWVRGYGLVDSPKAGAPGRRSTSRPCLRPPPARGAVLPRGLLVLADAGARGASSRARDRNGNGISPRMRSQAEYLRTIKSGGCTACHQLGNKARARFRRQLGTFPSTRMPGIGACSPGRPAAA